MTEQHLTPPPELVQQWQNQAPPSAPGIERLTHIATQAARWGADMELEACVEWLVANDWKAVHKYLRAARRPKPPSLAEQALSELNLTADPGGAELSRTQVELIRGALERLQELENNG